jgi:hypothetical protein
MAVAGDPVKSRRGKIESPTDAISGRYDSGKSQIVSSPHTVNTERKKGKGR